MEEFRRDIQLIRESQIRMEADLKYHIRRTDLLEKIVDDHKSQIEKIEPPIPLKEKLQILAFIAAIVASAVALLNYIGK